MGVELLSPELEVTPDLNLKIRIRVLSKVLYELINVCGADSSDTIEKGVLQKQIVNRITVSFIDNENIIRGEVIFLINWEKLEFSAKTNKDITLLKNIDINRLVSPKLDPVLYDVLKINIKKLKNSYNITKVETSYRYREQYTKDKKIHENTMKYMNHTDKYESKQKKIDSLNYELQTVFQGLDGSLEVLLRT